MTATLETLAVAADTRSMPSPRNQVSLSATKKLVPLGFNADDARLRPLESPGVSRSADCDGHSSGHLGRCLVDGVIVHCQVCDIRMIAKGPT